MSGFVCVTCRGLPGVRVETMSADQAEAHEQRGHDVRRAPDRDERRGGPHGPPLRDPEGERDGLGGRVDGELSVLDGERTGRRRADY